MKRLVVIGKSIHSLIFLFITSIRFKITGINVGARYLLKTFYIFGGLPGSIASRFLSKSEEIALKKVSTLSFRSGYSILEASSELRRKGYFVERALLNERLIESILDYSLSATGSFRAKDSGEGEMLDVKFDRNNPRSVRFDYTPTTVLKCKEIQTVLADERILALSQEYLGCQPILDFVAMWWHTKSEKADKNSAQLFHFDMDRLRWVKFFFYVTDVTSENGPHVFIESTHRDFGIPFSLRKRGYARLEDKEIERIVDKNRWIEFTGEKGTMIAEDTRGLHKGAHVKNGDRLLFQFQFTTSLYGEAEEPDLMVLKDEELTKELRTAMIKYPHVFQKIKVLK